MIKKIILNLFLSGLFIIGCLPVQATITASEAIKHDDNNIPVSAGVTNDSNKYIYMIRIDPTTGGLLTYLAASTNSIGTVGLNAGTNSIGTVGLNAGTNAIGSLTAGTASIGTVGLNAGTNDIGIIEGKGTAGTPAGGVLTVQGASSGTPIPASQSGTWNVVPTGGTSTGATLFKVRNLAGTVTAIKTSAGTLYGITVDNSQGTIAAYIQIFNVAAAGVTLGTTTPDLEYYVPALTSELIPFPAVGAAFTTAISIASTTTEGGATGSAAGVMVFAEYL